MDGALAVFASDGSPGPQWVVDSFARPGGVRGAPLWGEAGPGAASHRRLGETSSSWSRSSSKPWHRTASSHAASPTSCCGAVAVQPLGRQADACPNPASAGQTRPNVGTNSTHIGQTRHELVDIWADFDRCGAEIDQLRRNSAKMPILARIRLNLFRRRARIPNLARSFPTQARIR